MFEVRKFFVRTDRTQGLSEQFGRQFGEPTCRSWPTPFAVHMVYGCRPIKKFYCFVPANCKNIDDAGSVDLCTSGNFVDWMAKYCKKT